MMTLWDFKASTTTISLAGTTHGDSLVVRLLGRIRHRMRVAAARRELGGMTDETLRDLALSRCQLDYIAELSAQDPTWR